MNQYELYEKMMEGFVGACEEKLENNESGLRDDLEHDVVSRSVNRIEDIDDMISNLEDFKSKWVELNELRAQLGGAQKLSDVLRVMDYLEIDEDDALQIMDINISTSVMDTSNGEWPPNDKVLPEDNPKSLDYDPSEQILGVMEVKKMFAAVDESLANRVTPVKIDWESGIVTYVPPADGGSIDTEYVPE